MFGLLNQHWKKSELEVAAGHHPHLLFARMLLEQVAKSGERSNRILRLMRRSFATLWVNVGVRILRRTVYDWGFSEFSLSDAFWSSDESLNKIKISPSRTEIAKKSLKDSHKLLSFHLNLKTRLNGKEDSLWNLRGHQYHWQLTCHLQTILITLSLPSSSPRCRRTVSSFPFWLMTRQQ